MAGVDQTARNRVFVPQFCRTLGWPVAKTYTQSLAAIGKPDITWFASEYSDSIMLHFATLPKLAAAVYAVDHGVFSLFTYIDTASDPKTEAERHADRLALKWFVTEEKREAYVRLHPDRGQWTWERIKHSGGEIYDSDLR